MSIESPPPSETPQDAVRGVIDRLWSAGAAELVPRLVAPAYTVHRDPGDGWEGQTLDHAAYAERLAYCRAVLPDLDFTIEDLLVAERRPAADGARVVVRWTYRGTQRGALPGLGVTGNAVAVTGLTIYELVRGVGGWRVSGHWQETDRAGLLRQLGLPIP